MQSKQRDVHFLKEEKLDSKTSSKVQSIQKNHDNHLQTDGYKIARIWKWARQDVNKHLKFKLKLERVTAKGLYSNHRETFDKLAKVFNDNNVSPIEYIKFFAIDWCGSEDKIDSELLDVKTIKAFSKCKEEADLHLVHEVSRQHCKRMHPEWLVHNKRLHEASNQ